MALIRILLILIIAVAIIAEAINKGEKSGSATTISSNSNSKLVIYLMKHLYAMKSRVETLERNSASQNANLNRFGKDITAIKNRKETRCESGVVGQHSLSPHWPYIQQVKFRSAFSRTPSVTYGLYLMDDSRKTNTRINAEVRHVTRTGFRVTLNKWHNTILFGARISWMACGK